MLITEGMPGILRTGRCSKTAVSRSSTGTGDHRSYEDYKDPVTASKQLLSLGKGTGEVTEVLYEAARQYQLYGDDRMGEGSVVNVEYTFEKMVL